MRRFNAILRGAVVAAVCSTAALAVDSAATQPATPPLMPKIQAKPTFAPKPAVQPKLPASAKAPAQPPQQPQRPRQSFADMVRDLVVKGEVRPLKEVLDVVHKANPGDIVSVKLRHQKPHWIYHVRVVQNGRRTDLDIDGKSLKVLERK